MPHQAHQESGQNGSGELMSGQQMSGQSKSGQGYLHCRIGQWGLDWLDVDGGNRGVGGREDGEAGGRWTWRGRGRGLRARMQRTDVDSRQEGYRVPGGGGLLELELELQLDRGAEGVRIGVVRVVDIHPRAAGWASWLAVAMP